MFIFKAGPRKVFRLKPVRCAKKVADPWDRQLPRPASGDAKILLSVCNLIEI